MLSFDIETAPLADDVLRERLPDLDLSQFEPTEFDPESVKYGNTKDPVKREEKLTAKRDEHRKQQDELSNKRAEAVQAHWDNFKSKASLSAVTGFVHSIGLYNDRKDSFMILSPDHGDEALILSTFWSVCSSKISESTNLVGVNTHEFDLPFLMRRSWMLGVTIPHVICIGYTGKWPKFHDRFIDLRRCWLLGNHFTSTTSSFDHLAKAFNTSGKPEGVTGDQYHELWESDRDKAIDYLKNDCVQPTVWANHMGIA